MDSASFVSGLVLLGVCLAQPPACDKFIETANARCNVHLNAILERKLVRIVNSSSALEGGMLTNLLRFPEIACNTLNTPRFIMYHTCMYDEAKKCIADFWNDIYINSVLLENVIKHLCSNLNNVDVKCLTTPPAEVQPCYTTNALAVLTDASQYKKAKCAWNTGLVACMKPAYAGCTASGTADVLEEVYTMLALCSGMARACMNPYSFAAMFILAMIKRH